MRDYNEKELREIAEAARRFIIDDLCDTSGHCFDVLWAALRICDECQEVRLDDARVENGMKCGHCAYGR